MSSSQSNPVEIDNSCSHFRIGEELTAHTLPGIRRVLQQQLSCHREVEVDLSEVSIVDNKSVRAILAIQHKASRKDRALRFISRNQAFLKLLDSLKTQAFQR